MKLAAGVFVVTLSCSGESLAQVQPGQKIGLVQYLKASYAGITRDLVAAAERMPEADYGFTPSQMPEVRTYGGVIVHTAAAMFGACARVRGIENPVRDVEKKATTKAEIVKVLAESVAFCDAAFSALTDQSAEYVKQGPVEIPRVAALIGVLAHNAEMYGITTVYLRARNLVPPSSDRR